MYASGAPHRARNVPGKRANRQDPRWTLTGYVFVPHKKGNPPFFERQTQEPIYIDFETKLQDGSVSIQRCLLIMDETNRYLRN